MANRVETQPGVMIESSVWNNASYLLGYQGVVAGYKQSCNITSSGLTVTLNAGLIIAFGKNIVIQGSIITIAGQQNEPITFYVDIDMGANTVTFKTDNASDTDNLSFLASDDLFLNPTTGQYSFPLATAVCTPTGLSNIQMIATMLTPTTLGFDINDIYPINHCLFFVDNNALPGGSLDPNNLYPNTTWAKLGATGNNGYLNTGSNTTDPLNTNKGTPFSWSTTSVTTAETKLSTSNFGTHYHTWSHYHTLPSHSHTYTHYHNQTGTGNNVNTSLALTRATNAIAGAAGSSYFLQATNIGHNNLNILTDITEFSTVSTTTSLANSTAYNTGSSGSGSGHTHSFSTAHTGLIVWRRTG